MAHWFVTLDGHDTANSGESAADAFRTVTKGVSKLDAGDTLFIGGGVYREHVVVDGKTRVTITSIDGEQAVIDGSWPDFALSPSTEWEEGEAPDEYVTTVAWPASTNRGAFLFPDRHVRLITYSRLEDLQATQETFGPLLPGEGPLGPDMVPEDPGDPFTKRPWVYMGPGLFQGSDGIVHIRLSHTHHGVPGLEEYAGDTDARALPLAIWTAPDTTLTVSNSQTVHVTNLVVRFGGGPSVHLLATREVTFDHVQVLAGPYGVEVGVDCADTRFTNCTFDGGLPPWYFRSDRKDGYTMVGGVKNGLGEQTLKSLTFCRKGSDRTTFELCEFVNAHDLQLNGPGSVFRRNWVHNINDDGVFVGNAATELLISGNVFEQCLKVLSLASKSTAGPVVLHRNLVDLRKQTAKRRPLTIEGNEPELDERPVMFFGNLFKSNFGDPDLTVVHNTVLINQSNRAVHNLFRSYDGLSRRRVLNNIFVGIDNGAAVDRPLAYLPRVSDDAETRGNCYWGIDRAPRILLVVDVPDGDDPLRFPSIGDMRASPYFAASVVAHAPGYEDVGNSSDPALARFTGPLDFNWIEDLRPVAGGSADGGGVPLPPDLQPLDDPSTDSPPTIGCYPIGSPPLRVGVGGLTLRPRPRVAPPPPD